MPQPLTRGNPSMQKRQTARPIMPAPPAAGWPQHEDRVRGSRAAAFRAWPASAARPRRQANTRRMSRSVSSTPSSPTQSAMSAWRSADGSQQSPGTRRVDDGCDSFRGIAGLAQRRSRLVHDGLPSRRRPSETSAAGPAPCNAACVPVPADDRRKRVRTASRRASAGGSGATIAMPISASAALCNVDPVRRWSPSTIAWRPARCRIRTDADPCLPTARRAVRRCGFALVKSGGAQRRRQRCRRLVPMRGSV